MAGRPARPSSCRGKSRRRSGSRATQPRVRARRGWRKRLASPPRSASLSCTPRSCRCASAPPFHLARRRPSGGPTRGACRRRRHRRDRRCRAVARAATQPGARLVLQGDRPHRPDPRHFRRARRRPQKARCRLSWRIWTTSAHAWSGPGPTSNASAAASASWAALARRRSRPTAG